MVRRVLSPLQRLMANDRLQELWGEYATTLAVNHSLDVSADASTDERIEDFCFWFLNRLDIPYYQVRRGNAPIDEIDPDDFDAYGNCSSQPSNADRWACAQRPRS